MWQHSPGVLSFIQTCIEANVADLARLHALKKQIRFWPLYAFVIYSYMWFQSGRCYGDFIFVLQIIVIASKFRNEVLAANVNLFSPWVS